MAKKDPQKRTDADRRARQAERLSRHIRVLRCILGRGRWDAEALAAELECSTRTVHRILQTLTIAGVPWYFCSESQCYRVRPGFRYPGLGQDTDGVVTHVDKKSILSSAQQVLEDGEQFLASLRQFCHRLETSVGNGKSNSEGSEK